jgi:glycosyltransferase involved in cell wall biosynthesis
MIHNSNFSEMISSAMSKLSTLSVIVIVKNEEHDIAAGLESVKDLAEEIVVVDSGSTDSTVKICQRYTNNVTVNEFKGYGPQKQVALNRARGPWVLNIDADERVSPTLAEEIRLTLTSEPKVAGFDIPFRHFFLGKRLRFGGAAGETHLRLFRKDNASYGNDPVHEGIKVNGPIGRLRNPIDHYSYRDLPEYLEKRERYTSLIAQKKFAAGERFHFWHYARLPYEFVVRYFLKGGFLDGANGLLYARLSARYVWMKFSKLRDLEARSK